MNLEPAGNAAFEPKDALESSGKPLVNDDVSSSKSWLSYIPWGLAVVALFGIGLARWNAAESDHALANILTVLLGLLAWGSVWVGLRWHAKQVAFQWIWGLGPILAGLVSLGLFRFERLDSELVPQFSWRFEERAELPKALESGEREQLSTIFAATPDDFPQFLGPNRDGILDLELVDDWSSSPPKLAWKQPIGPGWSGFAIQGDVAITMEQREESEWVSAYAIEDGALLWRYEIAAMHTTVPGGTGPRSTPAIANDRVYACSAVGKFVCLALSSGEEIWSQDLLRLGDVESQAEFEQLVSWGRSGSPLVLGENVIVPLGGDPESAKPLIAFSAATGQEVWRAGTGQITYSSPVAYTIHDVKQVVFTSQDKVAGYVADTGEQLWEVPWPGVANANPAVSHPVRFGDSQLLLAKGYSEGAKLVSLEFSSGEWNVSELWKSRSVMKTKFATAVIQDGYAYGLSDGILECIDVATGKRKWKRGRYKHGQLLLVGEHLLILAETGELVLVAANPDKHQELAKFPVIEGVSWNTIALSGNRLLVRNSDESACVILPVVEHASGPDSASVEGETSPLKIGRYR